MRAKRAQQEGLQGNKLQSKSLCRDYTQITLVDPVSHGAILPDGRSGTSGSADDPQHHVVLPPDLVVAFHPGLGTDGELWSDAIDHVLDEQVPQAGE